MRRVILSLAILLLGSSALFCEEAKILERIVVTPSRLKTSLSENSRSVTILDEDSFDLSCYNDIPDIVGNLGGIDIRRRGVEGVQSDVSIRATTFEQNQVLIDGIKMNDPQTGHFNTDLPLTMMDVDRIEVLKGPSSSIYGPNSFGGAINVITKKPTDLKVILNAGAGSFDYFQGGVSASCPFGKFLKNRFSFDQRRSTGYMSETEFDILSLSNTTTFETHLGTYDFLFGYLKKDFGADSFYSNLYPNEEEHTDTRFFKIDGAFEKGDFKVAPKLFLRRHKDKFALDRNRPGWQTNYHTTYKYGGEIDFILENPFTDVVYGLEILRDTIDSTNVQKHRQTNTGMYLELSPHLLDDLYINAGARGDYFSTFGWECSPSVSMSYLAFKYFTLRSSIGRAYRIPTFTDLYYNDVANIGNSSLRPESSWTYEVGFDYRPPPANFSATFFHRDNYDTIDWTRLTSRDRWRASNIGSVRTNGLELSVNLLPRRVDKRLPVEKIFLSYTALDAYSKHDYLSKYALDYLKQEIVGGIVYKIFDFKNSWVLNYKKRVGDSGFIVVDTKVSKDIVKMNKTIFNIFLEISNLFDVEYSEQSNITMPGRWIKSGARVEF